MKTGIAKSNWLSDKGIRFDSSYHLSPGREYRKAIMMSPNGIQKLYHYTDAIFYGGRSKRNYVDGEINGVPFIGSSDMLKFGFGFSKYVSRKNFRNIDSSLLKEGWTLISRSGTIGKTVFVTKDLAGIAASEHIIRVVPNEKVKPGTLYAYLSSKFGYALLTQGTFGAVIRHIEPDYLSDLPVPVFSKDLQNSTHSLIEKAANLRVKANSILKYCRAKLKSDAGLEDLKNEEYEFFGTHNTNRKASVFIRNRSELGSVSINAFNYSKKVELLENRIKSQVNLSLWECLDDNKFFSSGSFKRFELNSPKSIKLINQSDVFDLRKEGKMLAPIYVKSDKLVEYGEVLIAGVGTLGEGETFCRAIFANEELEGQLISGEFIRMKTNSQVPSGYLYAWLSSDYGFRLIRKTQSGTKLCRPIQELLKNIPVPIIENEEMLKIDEQVKKAHTMLFEALNAENKAIELVENEIESWQKS